MRNYSLLGNFLMAYRLSNAFGCTPESWLNLQTFYDLAKVREKGEKLEIRQFFTEAQAA